MSQESDCQNRVLGNVLGKILTENNQHWSVSLWDGTFLVRITIFSLYWPDLPDLTSLPWFLVSLSVSFVVLLYTFWEQLTHILVDIQALSKLVH